MARQTSRKEFWQFCSKLLAQNPKVFCAKSKFFSEVSILIRYMQLLEHLWNRSLKVRKKIIQITNLFQNFFFQILQRTRGMELWHPLQNRFSKARKLWPHIPKTSWIFCSFGHLQCRFHNLPETLGQTPLFLKKSTQEYGIDQVIYSFDDSAGKFSRRIQKFLGWTPTIFPGRVLHFM